MLAAHVVGSSTVYSTIQAAVNAAPSGATINVDAGNYAELVTITKPMTIRGAQAGVDARLNNRLNGATSSESTVTGASTSSGQSSAFYINANDVTIDGFTVSGETNTSLYGAGIVIAPNRAGTHILDNIIQNNVSGLFLANSSSSDAAVIQHNVFRGNNNAGANGGRGIYTDGSVAGPTLTNVTIDSNAFIDNRGSTGTTGLEAACAFEASTPGAQTNIRVTNNVFDGNGKATLFFNTIGATLTGNEVTDALDKYSGTFRFEGNDHNVTITNNTMYDNTGPAVAVDSKGVPGDDSGFVVTNNNFYHNSTGWSGSKISVVVDGSVYDGTFDATNNWWGDASGPSGDGPGTGDSVYGIGHVVPGGQWSVSKGGAELYSPWSTSPIGTERAPYWGAHSATGALIQAEDYDQGGEGIAYHDTTSGNSGGKYRPNESVDIESSTDSGGGYDVYNAAAGDWLAYTVDLGQGGTYEADFRVAASKAGGRFHLQAYGQNVTGSIAVPNTGGNQKWTTISVTGIPLVSGVHDVRLVFDTNGAAGTAGSFNWFELINTAPANTPAAPSNLGASASGPNTVNLTWTDNSTNETGFKIERQTGSSGTWSQIATVGAGATSYADTTAASGTSYGYRVRATNSSGDSPYSNVATVTTPAVPSAPSNLSAVALSATQVSLSWTDTAPGIETGFAIERSADGVNFAQIGATAQSVTSLTDNTAVAGTTYTYRVRATSPAGNSGYSNSATVTTPTGNVVTTYLSDLNWVSATTGYGTVQKDKSVGGNPLTLRGVVYPKGIGTHAVSQIVYNLNGAYSTFQATVGVDDEENGKGIGSVDFQVVGDGKMLFDSGVVTNNSAALNVNVNIAGVKQLTLVANNGVAGSIDYDHADWGGARLLSSPVAPTAPSNLQATAVSSSQINLTWTDNSGANETGFGIERSTDGVNFTQIATVGQNVTSYSNTGLSASTTYTYRVRALSSIGNSAYSNTSTATTLSATVTPTYLSDLAWASATAGWGTVQKDATIVGNTITLRGVTYAKGLGTHANSTIVYNLNGQYTSFLADIGLDDEEIGKGNPSVDFQVIGDGKVLYDSGAVTLASAVKSLNVNVTGVQQLSLVVNTTISGNIDFDHADWANARVM
jgi:hypothetical protein